MPASSGSVGSSLSGVWQTVEKDTRGEPLLRLTIFTSNEYELAGTQRDKGLTFGKLGVLNMNSSTGRRMKSTYKYLTMRRMVTEGDIGKYEWERVAAAPTPPVKR